MKSAHPVLGVLLFLSPAGCIFSSDSPTVPPPRPKLEYVAPDSPENALLNLVRAYENQDLEAYSGVLAPEFEYVFPEIAEACTDSWNRDFELLATADMFSEDLVGSIHVTLEHLPAVPANEVGMEGTMRVRSTTAEAEIARRDGITLSTSGDLHEFYFRPGMLEGEDSSHWYLVRWRDLAGSHAPHPPDEPTPVIPLRWWEIKCWFIQ